MIQIKSPHQKKHTDILLVLRLNEAYWGQSMTQYQIRERLKISTSVMDRVLFYSRAEWYAFKKKWELTQPSNNETLSVGRSNDLT